MKIKLNKSQWEEMGKKAGWSVLDTQLELMSEKREWMKEFISEQPQFLSLWAEFVLRKNGGRWGTPSKT